MRTLAPLHDALAASLAADLTREEARSLVFVFLASALGALLACWHIRLLPPTIVLEIVLGRDLGCGRRVAHRCGDAVGARLPAHGDRLMSRDVVVVTGRETSPGDAATEPQVGSPPGTNGPHRLH